MLRNRPTSVVLLLLAAACCALYLPFLANPPFFDDRYLFSGYKFADYALTPLDLGLRHPAYFSLAIVQVLSGSIVVHRAVSLAFHIACAWALYALVRELQRARPQAAPQGDGASPAAFGVAAAATGLFALHPVSVYAAGYLVQRSIVLATLFGLLSATLYLRGLREARYRYAVGAGALYSLAVLCKEHALLVPAAAAVGALLRAAPARLALRYTALYFAACAPAGIMILLIAKGIVGTRYEPDFGAVAAQITEPQFSAMAQDRPWLGSALTQAALFFRYLGIWLWPRTGAMALDLRIDFASGWGAPAATAAVVAFLAFGALGAFLLARRGRAAVAGFGLLWFWVLFLLEFSVVRFQEPFVLYRSYLWAPGLAVAVAALLPAAFARLPSRAVVAALGAAGAIVFVQAWDRLQSMSSGLALWEDAAAKLPPQPIPGGWRTLYSLGREYLNADMPDKALAVNDRCLAEYPGVYHCFFARAAIHLHQRQYQAAIPYLLKAVAAAPAEGAARHHLGLAVEELGCREQARALYRLSYELGFIGATFRLQSMDRPGKGLLQSSTQRARDCTAPALPAAVFKAP